jgi:hypothetical protein
LSNMNFKSRIFDESTTINLVFVRQKMFKVRNDRKWIKKKSQMAGKWRRLHNEELNGLYSSLNIVRVIKSRIM